MTDEVPRWRERRPRPSNSTATGRQFELKCARLDAEQLSPPLVRPSTLSLLGLVRHLARSRDSWDPGGCSRAGMDLPRLDRTDRTRPRLQPRLADEAVVADVWALCRCEVDDVVVYPPATSRLPRASACSSTARPQRSRDIVVHLIEEHACDVGHAHPLRDSGIERPHWSESMVPVRRRRCASAARRRSQARSLARWRSQSPPVSISARRRGSSAPWNPEDETVVSRSTESHQRGSAMASSSPAYVACLEVVVHTVIVKLVAARDRSGDHAGRPRRPARFP